MAESIRVILVPHFDTAARERLAAVSSRLELRYLDWAELAGIRTLEDPTAEVLVTYRVPDPLSRLPRLRWIQLLTAGLDSILADDPWSYGMTVTSASGVFATEMAEYVLGALLDVNQHAGARRAHQSARTWPADNDDLVGRPLRGQTIVIVGYGGAGREIARLTSAFGMRVIAVKARPAEHRDTSFRVPGTGDPDGSLPERIVGLDSLAEVAAEADALIIALPLTPATRGLVDRTLLEALPPGAVLVNVARGPVLDEPALADLLRARALRAYLDVFSDEPLPRDSPWWDLPNCVVTPHVSGGDAGAWPILTDLVAENLRRYVAGDELINVIERTRAFGRPS